VGVTEVTQMTWDEMSPAMRAMIGYEPNGSLDVEHPQEQFLEMLKTPIVRWEGGVAFFGMNEIVEAGRNPDITSANPFTGNGVGMGSREPLIPLHVDGDVHKRYRKLLDPLLAPKRMAALEPDVRKLADELIDGFIGDEQVEFHDAFCVPLPCIMFLRLFGMPMEDLDFLIACKDGVLKNAATTFEEHEELAWQAGDRLRERLTLRLAERRRSGEVRDDLIGAFMSFELDGEQLNDAEIVNLMHMFTIAGLDTVTSSLSVIVGWLALHEEERHRILAEPDLLNPAIEEIMRWESPVPQGGARWAKVDTEIAGVAVKAGEMVSLTWASANIDPAAFEHPLEVDLTREPNRHIAFAAGLHRCLGSHLARAELRAAVDQFHKRVRDYAVADGDHIDWALHGVREAKRLPLTFTPA